MAGIDRRLNAIYSDALTAALKRHKALLKTIGDVNTGKKKPPQFYVDTGRVDEWRAGFVRQLMRQENIIEDIQASLAEAGGKAVDAIRADVAAQYGYTRTMCAKEIERAAKLGGLTIQPDFAVYDKNQLAVLTRAKEGPFTKIAYRNLGQNAAAVRRLQDEMAQSVILGESQEKIIKRIHGVVGNTAYNARRTAQTERTRIQSQASYDTATEAAEMGIRLYDEWRCQMAPPIPGRPGTGSRESHRELDGKIVPHGEGFDTIHGQHLFFPGDPSAAAFEVINCHCVLEVGVLLDNEFIENGKIVTREAVAKTADGRAALVQVQEQTSGVMAAGQEFVPAGSIAEAEAYAKDAFGIQAKYDGAASLEYANACNQAVGEMANTYGRERFALKVIEKYPKRPLDGVSAAYEHVYERVWLMRAKAKTAFRDMVKEIEAEFAAGAWSTKDPLHVIRHELGHALYYGNRPGPDVAHKLEALLQDGRRQAGCYISPRGRAFDFSAYQRAGKTVADFEADMKSAGTFFSAYGLTEVGEMVAEANAECLTGHPRPFARLVIDTLMGRN